MTNIGREGGKVTMYLLKEVSVLLHLFCQSRVLTNETLQVIGIALGMNGDFRGDSVGPLGRD
ncbi:MAG: hypothetical protein M3256_26685, partial [Actinomycetota bacterium]|nr:hypothetical protein [Actinomycetota bacterium]